MFDSPDKLALGLLTGVIFGLLLQKDPVAAILCRIEMKRDRVTAFGDAGEAGARFCRGKIVQPRREQEVVGRRDPFFRLNLRHLLSTLQTDVDVVPEKHGLTALARTVQGHIPVPKIPQGPEEATVVGLVEGAKSALRHEQVP